MEVFKTKKFFVLITQFLGGLCFAGLAFSLSTDYYVALSLTFFALIAFNSATHDVAADGIYIETLSNEEQAKYVGWQGAFWNIGKVLAQGGLVWVAGQLEKKFSVKVAWMSVMGVFAILLVSFSAYHAQVLPKGKPAQTGRSAGEILRETGNVLVTFFKKKNVFWGLAFVLFYRFAEGQAQKIFPLFLRADRVKGGLGLTTSEAGLAYGTFGAAAFILGSICGGYFAAKLNLRRALLPLCAIFNLPYIAYLVLVIVQPTNLVFTGTAIVIEMFGYGFGFVGVTLFMMQQIAPGPYKMAHYAIATSVMNFGLILPGLWSGHLSDAIGYKNFFIWVMISTIFSFIAAWRVPFKSDEDIAAESAVEPQPQAA
jgi:PAT family beta-lactamase induction signal transducer AmpG